MTWAWRGHGHAWAHALQRACHEALARIRRCEQRVRDAGKEGALRVPGNESAPRGTLLLAPAWLFAHFPYGSFFGAFQTCHEGHWGWAGRSAVERRLCMPAHRVPVVMVGSMAHADARRADAHAWPDGASP